MMTATLDDVAKKSKREPTAEVRAEEEMVRRARQQGPVADPPGRAVEAAFVRGRLIPSQVWPTTLLQNIPHRVSSAHGQTDRSAAA
jgi:hypothetical protein